MGAEHFIFLNSANMLKTRLNFFAFCTSTRYFILEKAIFSISFISGSITEFFVTPDIV